jgi:ketosteroid isomerase-like protein
LTPDGVELEGVHMEREIEPDDRIERVRRAYDAFNAGDFYAAREIFHPDAEWHPYLGALEGELYRGRDQILAMWKGLGDAFGDSLRMEILRVVEHGDQLLVDVEAYAVGTGSGVEVNHRWTQLVDWRDGLVFRIRAYDDAQQALAADEGSVEQ